MQNMKMHKHMKKNKNLPTTSDSHQKVNVIIVADVWIKPHVLLLRRLLSVAKGEHMLRIRAHKAEARSQLILFSSKWGALRGSDC